jgi:Fic family protein
MDTDEIEFLQQSNYIEGVRNGLDDSVRAWKYLKRQKTLDIDVLGIVHRLLMKNRNIPEDQLGCYRTVNVFIGDRQGLTPGLILNAMDGWMFNVEIKPSDWLQHHVQFERIHPFIDGNGRVGRMLMNWERLKINLPILVIKEEDRWEYYNWFK